MDNPFPAGTFEYVWFANWLPIAAAVVAITMGVTIWTYTKTNLYGISMRALGALAIWGTFPLAIEQIGFNVAGDNYTMIFVNVLGVSGAVGLVLFHGLTRLLSNSETPAVVAIPGGGQFDLTSVIKTDRRESSATIAGGTGMTVVTPMTQAGRAGSGAEHQTVFLDKPAKKPGLLLAVSDGENAGEVCQVTEGETTIGRSSENHLQLGDSTVSRTHAVIRRNGDTIELDDLGSSSGTKVNGTRVSGQRVNSTSIIKIGETEIQLVQIENPAAKPAMSGDEHRTMMASDLRPNSGYVAVVRKGQDAGASFELHSGDNIIGRGDAADIDLGDSAVSRKHAVIREVGQGFVVSDLGSNNGTSVDGKKVIGTTLKNGDVIEMGLVKVSVINPGMAA